MKKELTFKLNIMVDMDEWDEIEYDYEIDITNEDLAEYLMPNGNNSVEFVNGFENAINKTSKYFDLDTIVDEDEDFKEFLLDKYYDDAMDAYDEDEKDNKEFKKMCDTNRPL